MTSEQDSQEVEQLMREAEELKNYLERPDISSEEKLERAIEVRARHQKIISERRRNRPPIRLVPLPPQLLRPAGAAPTTAKGKIMTYEQMETTMQFILEQQAAMTIKQSGFNEWQKQMAAENAERDRQFNEWQKQMAAENAERDRQFNEWRKQMAAESAKRNRQIDQRFDQMIAASAKQISQIHEALTKTHHDLAILIADSDWYKASIAEHEELMNQLVEQMNRLTETVDRMGQQNISLGDKIEALAETVKNLIKGGDNGWQQH